MTLTLQQTPTLSIAPWKCELDPNNTCTVGVADLFGRFHIAEWNVKNGCLNVKQSFAVKEDSSRRWMRFAFLLDSPGEILFSRYGNKAILKCCLPAGNAVELIQQYSVHKGKKRSNEKFAFDRML